MNFFNFLTKSIKHTHNQRLLQRHILCTAVPCKSRNYHAVPRLYHNPTVFRCVQYIATSVGQVKFIVKGSNTSYLQQLLNQPNSHQTQTEFIEQITSHYLLYGNAYILMQFDQNMHPASMHILNPNHMTVIPGKYGEPEGFIHEVNNTKTEFNYRKNNIKQILHIKNFNPNPDEPFLGFSPLTPASKAIKQIDLFHDQNAATLTQSCHPSGVFYYKGTIPLNESEETQLIAKLQEAMTSHTPLLLDNDIEWKPFPQPQVLGYSESTIQAEKTIAQIYNIPPSLIGITEPKFSNFAESRKQFWQDAVMPVIKKHTEMLHHWLTPMIDSTLTITWDPQSIPNCAIES